MKGTIVQNVNCEDPNGEGCPTSVQAPRAFDNPNSCCDLDADGHQSIACNGDDCDDHNINIFPGAGENCHDGIDNDCDGLADSSDPLCAPLTACPNIQDFLDCLQFAGLWFDYPYCWCWYTSPILIDTRGNGFDLTDANNGVNFDFKPDGITERIAWTESHSDDAFLVLDRNGNGTIDDGTELFGNLTPQPLSNHRNGFLALAEYDKPQNGGNSDGRIDRRDNIFSSLRLWLDVNHNGFSEQFELHTLVELNIHTLSLDFKESRRQDRNGNLFRYRAKVYDGHGAQVGRWAWDIFLAMQR